MSSHTASNNTGPGGGGHVHIGTAVTAHGGPQPSGSGTLPFTGADVGLYAAVGVAMIAGGMIARLRAGARR